MLQRSGWVSSARFPSACRVPRIIEKIQNQYGFNGDFGFPAFFAGGKLAGDEQAAFSPDAEAFAAVG